VLGSQNMDQHKIEEKDSGDPLVDGHIGLDVGVLEHTVDVLSIHLHDKIFDTDEVEMESTECLEQTIELELGLQVMGLAFVPSNGTKAGGMVVAISTVLSKDPPCTVPRQVYREKHRAVRVVVNGDESWRGSYGILKGLHGSLVLVQPSEGDALASEVYKRTCK
jgi:hypothetical protein